jgi:predicted nucleic acid-binding protein
VLVVDASVLAPAIADGGPDGERVRARFSGERLAAPDLVRVEVLSVFRRQLATGALTMRQAASAVDDLMSLPIDIYPAERLLRRAWALRSNVTPSDACYVALAEALECALLTADARLAGAPRTKCRFELL